MRIAVDALGGDNAPAEVVAGAVRAAKSLPRDEILLVGDPVAIRAKLGSGSPSNVSVREAGEAIGMEEEPSVALRRRPDASVAVAAGLVRDGEADALFSAGNTGATVAGALLRIGRLKDCRRPAIATVLPFPSPALLLDAGATVSCRPQDLLNFAILGAVFAERYFGLDGAARVGLVNVGEEPGKGTDLAKEAHALISASGARFVGNVEGRDVGRGVADVLVADGFTGNVVLKTAEGVAREILGMVRSAMTGGGVVSKLAAGVLRPRLVGVRDRVDPENYGGSYLLGVRGPVVIGHGNSRARGVENAIIGISRTGGGLTAALEEALGSVHARQAGGILNDRPVGRIVGVGRALGSRVVTNGDLEDVLDTTDEWISTRTGISERRFVGEDESCATLAIQASKEALEHAGVDAESIDLIICGTSTAPESMPSVACLIGEEIGVPGVGAMDLAAACSGFSYAATVAASMLRSGVATRVLLVGADAMSTIVDQGDRSTAVLFGDGAGAAVLDAGDGRSGFVDHILGADGRGAPLGRAGHPGDDHKLYQNGREVFKFAVRIFPEMVEKLLSRNNVSPEEVQYVIPHQANARIIKAAAKKMEVPEERVVINLNRFGNTSAASIPLSYPDIYDALEPGKYIVTVGFGFGLTWAANLYRI